MRKYVNFFQPSLKLLEKARQGAKVSKEYDRAKTPFQRILLSEHIDRAKKDMLTAEYKTLDPVNILAQLKTLQDELWKFSWNKSSCEKSDFVVTKKNIQDQNKLQLEETDNVNRYYHSSKKLDLRKAPRTWQTRKDPFENVWDEIRLRLELMPETTARDIMQWLMGKHSSQFSLGQTRTLQRRIAQWRQEQESQEDKLRALMINQMPPPSTNFITDTGIQINLNCKKECVEIT